MTLQLSPPRQGRAVPPTSGRTAGSAGPCRSKKGLLSTSPVMFSTSRPARRRTRSSHKRGDQSTRRVAIYAHLGATRVGGDGSQRPFQLRVVARQIGGEVGGLTVTPERPHLCRSSA